ncbi:hypothetical protein BC827DRAFT_1270854 [Russula dissimulans]|nr:hypothetical protein BC827DRAFT_1270854 [Russula dissimulans]
MSGSSPTPVQLDLGPSTAEPFAPPSSSPTDSAPWSMSPSSQSVSFFSGGASPPLIAGLVTIGAFAIGLVSICAWRRFMGGEPLRNLLPFPGQHRRPRTAPYRSRGRQNRQTSLDAANGRPEIFDAWTETRTVDVVKWEGSVVSFHFLSSVYYLPASFVVVVVVPFSATLAMEEVAKAGCKSDCGVSTRTEEVDGGSTIDEVLREKQLLSEDANGRLRLAVLLRMPSPSHTEAAHSDVGGVSGCPVQGELAIGLIEVPWTGEDLRDPSDT